MALVKRIRSLKGVGILADRTARDDNPNFSNVNLIYGFNGSGKSTLSRIFGCLQSGYLHDDFSEDCAFEIELEDGSTYGAPHDLTGLEGRICVFNADFIRENLKWDTGTAASIFYISQDQAEAATLLKDAKKRHATQQVALMGMVQTAKASSKNFSTYCTERARTIHNARRLGTRKYEAPKLRADYSMETFDEACILTTEKFAALQEIVSRTAAPPPLTVIEINVETISVLINDAAELCDLSLGVEILKELEQHPGMVPWMKEGLDYHVANKLQDCLLCQNIFSNSRRDQLVRALDSKLSNFMREVERTVGDTQILRNSAVLNLLSLPKIAELEPSFQAQYSRQLEAFDVAAKNIRLLLSEASSALSTRRKEPTKIAPHSLPSKPDIERVMKEFSSVLYSINDLILKHNTSVKNFSKSQSDASLSILRHFLIEGENEFETAKRAAEDDALAERNASEALHELKQEIADLEAKLRVHGPAASKITRLVHDYLGHKELTIVVSDPGYSLYRNEKPVKGQPSEGEKTAIALCYFLTTLEAEGRALENLIVVIDDPISSLDTKAMNYACSLVLKKLETAGQLFVLTHNQHCMNEFKKAWKAIAYPKNASATPTGRLLYMDVQLSDSNAKRSARIVELSPLLRDYDSEYHFLCSQVLLFEAAGTDHSPNILLMPNAMRRVMEIFLAFKVPGTGPIRDKLKCLTNRHPELNTTRIAALERLSQVESHSDNLDDLIGHSPMIVEEVRQMCSALLELMDVVDKPHTRAIKKQCKRALN